MSNALRSISKGFWAQYPAGTKLTWTFIVHQLREDVTFLSNFRKLLQSLNWRLTRVWQVLVFPYAKDLGQFVRPHTPQSSKAARLAYLVSGYLLVYFFAVWIFFALAALTVSAFVVLPVIALTLVSVSVILVSLMFISWFAFYRYPVFEVVLPKVRSTIMSNNAKIYSQLPADTPTIRVVRLKSGSRGRIIECETLNGLLPDMVFEALSYVWGVTLVPYKIRVDDKPFYVTHNLRSALEELRLPDRDRFLWVDAMCINQDDNIERGIQVQMMRDIYAQASRTIVWLGTGTRSTPAAFNFMESFNDLGLDGKEAFWQNRESIESIKSIRREINAILQCDWWERAWIIQEVVVSQHVVVQRGSSQVKWDHLHDLIAYSPVAEEHLTIRFAQNVQKIRDQNGAYEATSGSLLDLVYAFRHQSASFGSDKIYALMGLLPASSADLLTPDYNETSEIVFMQFAISCLEHNRNLQVIAYAAGASLQEVSWCRDWSFDNDDTFETTALSASRYSASGTHVPAYTVDFSTQVLSLQGYQIDKVDRVGDFHQENQSVTDWDVLLRAWERVARVNGTTSDRAFDRTITVDSWNEDSLDWKQRVPRSPNNIRTEGNMMYRKTLEKTCSNRRFFVTRDGRYGLGPWNLKKGDTLCVLFGGQTPFILRQVTGRRAKFSSLDNKADAVKYYRVIGETYVDGVMYYDGSMENDIRSGRVVPEWFHLT